MYVDDLLLEDTNDVIETKKKLNEVFTVTDFGPCSFLGISIDRTDYDLFLLLGAYDQKVMTDAGMENLKPVQSPLPLCHQLYEERRMKTKKDRNGR